MDKIAIITDVHGCLLSTKEVLNDIEKRNINTIYCLGDLVAKGSQPKETLELVREKCKVVIKGNCDDIVGDKGTTNEHFWNKEKIGKENMEYLSSLPLFYEFYMSGLKIRLMHASVESIYKTINMYNISENTNREVEQLFTKINEELEEPDIVIFGHIHSPFFYRKGIKTAIGVGSVSNGCDIKIKAEKEVQYSSYLVLEGEFGEENKVSSISYEFVKIPYDYKKEIENLKNSDMPNKEMAIEELKTGKYVAR